MSCARTNLYDPYHNNQKIGVSLCLSEEIQWLWDKNITVLDCDCGDREDLGYIVVAEKDIDTMLSLGYEPYVYKDCERYDTFIPKSYKHIDKKYFG